MTPYAQLVLFLLVATSKLPLVLTVNPLPDVDRALHDDFGDLAMSSTSSSTSTRNRPVESLTTQNKLADDGRGVTQTPRSDGNAPPDGKRMLPPGRISDPNHLKDDHVIAEELKLKYRSLIALLDALPTHLSETSPVLLECNLSLIDFKNVLEKLKVYQERYLTAVPDSNQQAPRASIEDLREIFHSITFRPPSEYLTEHDGKPLDDMHRIKTLHVKTTFERCVFKTLDYLYHSQLIDREQMNSFFNTPETLQRTAKHLPDLFSEPKLAFTAYHTFIPEINFILNDWHTEHLHRCLKDLDKQVQQQVIYETLKITIQNVGYFEERASRSHEEHVRSKQGPDYEKFTKNPVSSSINDFVCKGDFLATFQRWSSSSSRRDGKNDLLRDHIEKMIELFVGEAHQDSKLVKTDLLLAWQKIETLLNYYTLRFIMHYANQDLNRLIDYLIPDGFNWKFRWTTLGLGIRQLVERETDYGYFLLFPVEARSIIPHQVSRQNQVNLRKKIDDYEFNSAWFLKEYYLKESIWGVKPNALLEYIGALSMNPIEKDLNSWLQPKNVFLSKPSGKKASDKFLQYLQVSYNMLDLSASQLKSINEKFSKTYQEEMKKPSFTYASVLFQERDQ